MNSDLHYRPYSTQNFHADDFYSTGFVESNDQQPRYRETCVGTIDTQLYGDNLNQLCRETSRKIDVLKTTIGRKKKEGNKDIHMQYTVVVDPNRPLKTHNEKIAKKAAWQDTNVMFTSPAVIKNIGDFGNDEIESTVTDDGIAMTFCYLCTTMEEHKRHMLHKREKRPYTGRPRVEYIAPKPRVKKKEEKVDLSGTYTHLYRVDVYTGDVPNAGTNANVHITIKGSKDVLHRTALTKGRGSSKFAFLRNTKETFFLKAPHLGNLEIVTIEHDGMDKKHSWYLEKIDITDIEIDHVWTFYCCNWLSLHIEDYRLKRDLVGQPLEKEQSEYEITVITGNKTFSGTNANIFLTMFGKKGESKKIQLVDKTKNKGAFERGKTDVFYVKMPSLGELRKIRVEHDDKGFASGWFLERIQIVNRHNPKQTFYFLYNGWIGKDIGDGKLYRDIYAKKFLPKELKNARGEKTSYVVVVKTGNIRYAGTDADVFVQLYGKEHTSARIKLDDSKNNFEKGMVDTFEIQAADVGPLTKILIGHDNSGPGAGWFLEDVKIRRYIRRAEQKAYLLKVKKQMKKNKQKTDAEENNQFEEDMRSLRLGRQSTSPSQDSRSTSSLRPSSSYLRPKSADDRKKKKRKEKESVSDTDSQSSSESDSGSGEEEEEERGKKKRQQAMKRKQSLKSKNKNGEDLVFKVPLYEEYYFVCNKWLAIDEQDGLVERELPVVSSKMYFKD